MATDHQHHHSSHGDDGGGPLNHETTDISLEGVGKLTIGFALVLFVVTGVMYGSYRLLDRRSDAQQVPIHRISDRPGGSEEIIPNLVDKVNEMQNVGRTPAGPRLLTNEPLWLAEIKKTQQDALTTYGWVNKDAGTVRLPIERAKGLIVERGLPQTAASDAVPADGTTAPAADPGGMEATVGTPLPTTTPQSTTAGSGPRPGSN